MSLLLGSVPTEAEAVKSEGRAECRGPREWSPGAGDLMKSAS